MKETTKHNKTHIPKTVDCYYNKKTSHPHVNNEIAVVAKLYSMSNIAQTLFTRWFNHILPIIEFVSTKTTRLSWFTSVISI